MSSNRILFRSLVLAALVVSVAGASGCKWFRKGNALYAQSPENRPLEVPPDLDRPNTDGAMKVPATGTTPASRSTLLAPAASTANSTGFNVAGDRDAVFEKVGVALAAIEGVNVVSRAQILGTYDIDYEGSKFLVRVVKVPDGAYVSAVDPRGLAATGDGPAKLMASLKAALGG